MRNCYGVDDVIDCVFLMWLVPYQQKSFQILQMQTNFMIKKTQLTNNKHLTQPFGQTTMDPTNSRQSSQAKQVVQAQRQPSSNLRQTQPKTQFIPTPSQQRVVKQETMQTFTSPPDTEESRQIQVFEQKFRQQQQQIEALQKDFQRREKQSAEEMQKKDKKIEELTNQLKRFERENKALRERLVAQSQSQQQVVQSTIDPEEARSLIMALHLQERERRQAQAMQYYAFMEEAMNPQQRPQINDPNYVDTDNMTYEQLLELQEKIGHVSRGLTKEQVKKIPKVKVSLSNKMRLPEVCTICYSEFKCDEKYRKLGCSHAYHGKCIKQWLLNERKCPICKVEVNIS